MGKQTACWPLRCNVSPAFASHNENNYLMASSLHFLFQEIGLYLCTASNRSKQFGSFELRRSSSMWNIELYVITLKGKLTTHQHMRQGSHWVIRFRSCYHRATVLSGALSRLYNHTTWKRVVLIDCFRPRFENSQTTNLLGCKKTSKMVPPPDIAPHQNVVDAAKLAKEVSPSNTNFLRPLFYTY